MASDNAGQPSERVSVAEALAERAWHVEEADGPAAALGLYEEVVELVRDGNDARTTSLRIWALDALSQTHAALGNVAESRAAASEVVDKYFDDPPADALETVPFAVFRLAALWADAGETVEAIALLRRLIERYGRPGVPDYRLTAAVAHANVGRILDAQGDHEDEVRRERQAVIELLGKPGDEDAQALVDETGEPMARLALAEALAAEAHVLHTEHRHEDADARLRELVDRFASATDGEIQEFVTWANDALSNSPRPRKRGPLRRRR